MASPELSRRVERVVAYPPLRPRRPPASRVPRGAARRRQLRGLTGQVARGDPAGRAEPAEAPRGSERLARLECRRGLSPARGLAHVRLPDLGWPGGEARMGAAGGLSRGEGSTCKRVPT